MSTRLSSKLMLLGGEPTHWCPGCQMLHRITVNVPGTINGARWTWNNDPVNPSFAPSINIVGRCHYFINDGVIQYCADSTHGLAGKSVQLPDIPVGELDE